MKRHFIAKRWLKVGCLVAVCAVALGCTAAVKADNEQGKPAAAEGDEVTFVYPEVPASIVDSGSG